MCRLLVCCSWLLLLGLTLPCEAATGRIIKVLPFFLDMQGRHSLSPSLFERDAYQAQLRLSPEKVSGVLYDVHWKVKGRVIAPLKLRVELRGIAQGTLPRQRTLEMTVSPAGGRWLGHWSGLILTGEQYKAFGEVTAWRATLWEGDRLLGEQQSFLW